MNSSLKTIVWRASISIAILIIIVSGFYTEENYRGLAAWQKTEQVLTARGESLNWTNYIPPPVPDDKNFFKAPMMAEWFVRSTNLTYRALQSVLENPDNTTNFITGFSASNYLAWCVTLDPQFNQVRDALKRPMSRIDGDYSVAYNQPTPNFISYREASQVLAHKAKCHLVLGQPDKALEDLTELHKLNLTLVNSGKSVAFISAMMHAAIFTLYADVIAFGLNSHSWRESQLVTIQNQLDELDILATATTALRHNQAEQCHLLDTLYTSEIMRGTAVPKSASDFGWWLMPNGWIAQNKAVSVNLYERVIQGFNLTNRTVSPYKLKAADMGRNRIFRQITPYNYFAALLSPRFNKGAIALGRVQTWVDQAKIACALERYRLTDGKYPATLSALIPQYIEKIPNDVISGTPMKYRLKDEQTFVLYSVGWNESDEGGIIVLDEDGNEDRESGDWVWHYSEL